MHAHLLELAKQMEWADAVVWQTVLASDAARDDRQTRTLLHHVHLVQHAFLSVWREEPLQLPEPGEFADAAALARWGRDGHAGVQSFLAAADAAALGREIHVPWAAEVEKAFDRTVVAPTLAQTATQLSLHSAHHRGQVNTRLRELGAAPTYTDFIVWVWWGQPEADWACVAQR